MLLADDMFVCRDIGRITWPVVGVICPNIEGLEIVNQFLADFILPSPEHERQDTSAHCVDGIPKPALVLFVADVTPLFVSLNIYRRIKQMPNFHGDLTRTDRGVHRDDLSGLFFSVAITVFLPMPKTLAVSRMPLPFMAISTACSLMPGSQAR